ncbi:MAG: aldehyde-activating protein [Hyphomicrobiales bacterium]|nr:MAG: aldehyde-activating protein [Hyphomicrobiales bacterium]
MSTSFQNQTGDDDRHTGQCLCGSVRYSVVGPLRPVIGCHCRSCRRQSGHFVAATQAPRVAIDIDGLKNITWYQATDAARRGFCRKCGSLMFWEPVGGDVLSLMAGSMDEPTGLRLSAHIHVSEKGDYYDIEDDLPQFSAR